MHVAAVVFDLDGTLIDSYALIAAAFRHAARTVLGRSLSDEEVWAHWGEPLPVRAGHVAADRTAEVMDAYTAYYDAHHDRLCRPFAGVIEMLAQLSARGCALGIATSKRRRSTMQAVEAFGFAAWIRAWVAAEDVASPKPSPEPVTLVLERLGARPPDALLVGDGLYDIRAAQTAGVRSVAAMWGTREAQAVLAAGPDYVAMHPQDVVALVGSE